MSGAADGAQYAGLTRELAERIVAAAPLRDAAAVEAARAGVLDWLAAALSARTDTGAGRIAAALGAGSAAAVGGARDVGFPSTVLGYDCRLAPLDAALVNGYLSHALDYDDVHESMRGHPSAVVLPALLAEAEERGSAGADWLAAYIVGVETMCRLGLALGPRHYEAGWHSTATLGALGAAAACARLIGLSAEQTVHALGLAATQAGGLRVHFGSEVKPLHAGLAARAGLMAARLAEAGIAGDPEPLEGRLGFLTIFGGGEARAELVLEGWGAGSGGAWQICTPGLWFKRYAFCSAAQHAADAALAIRGACPLAAADIERVIVTYPPGGDAALVIREPKNGVEGRFSAEYVVACALTGVSLGMDTFGEAPIPDEVQAVIAKIERQYDAHLRPSPAAMPKGRFTVVQVVMADGSMYEERIDCPRGSPGRPLSEQERLAKYADAISGMDAAWQAMPQRIERLEDVTDMRGFLP